MYSVLEAVFPFQTEEDISSLTPYKTDLEYLDDHFQVGSRGIVVTLAMTVPPSCTVPSCVVC